MKDFVIINGEKRRFEANFNALGKALYLLGLDDLNGLIEVSQIKPSSFPILFSCCLNEGARLEGDSWTITPEDTGTQPLTVIQEMLTLFVRQISPDTAPAEPKKAVPKQ